MKFGISIQGFKRLAIYSDNYYDWSNKYSLQDILDRWSSNSQKLADEGPFYYPIEEVWNIKEYTWTEESSRIGPEDYQDLRESMQERGWDSSDPAVVQMGKNAIMKVGEGNHRLAIAQELGISEIPVRIEFYQDVKLDEQYYEEEEVPQESAQSFDERFPQKEVSPEEEEQVQDLMKLFEI